MARRQYGSKAAYEAERGAIRDQNREWERKWNMTDEERAAEDRAEKKAYVARQLDDPEKGMMLFAGFLMAAMAGGKSAADGAKQADSAVALLRSRFT